MSGDDDSQTEDSWTMNLTQKEVTEMLCKWREDNSRNSHKVRDLWSRFNLDKNLGEEKWPVIEQVCIAAMDLQDHHLLKDCLVELEAKFPGSARVKKLKVMGRLEVRERFDEALKTYDDMIQSDDSNAILYKRKIAILISQKKIPDAIRELTEYLRKFMNDQEAWLELSDLYIQEQEYSRAAFCLEELILSNPHNHFYHQKYAEINYTIGSTESLEVARAYFSQALKLNPGNMRALFGLYLTSTNLASSPKLTSQKRKENLKNASWTMAQINRAYQNQRASSSGSSLDDNSTDPHLLSSLEGMVSSLHINNP